jgi:hypothetical protein
MAKSKTETSIEPTEENTAPEVVAAPEPKAEPECCKYRVSYNLKTPPYAGSIEVEAHDELEAIKKANDHFGIIKPAVAPTCSKC